MPVPVWAAAPGCSARGKDKGHEPVPAGGAGRRTVGDEGLGARGFCVALLHFTPAVDYTKMLSVCSISTKSESVLTDLEDEVSPSFWSGSSI